MPVLVFLLIVVGLIAPVRVSYGWPLTPARVLRYFDPPAAPWLPGHRGVDLAGSPGAEVRSAGAGRVVYAGDLAGRGVVSVQHPDGLRTTYEPVTPTVAPGDAVERGSRLGTLDPGHPGCGAAACLHWGLRHGDLYLDPLALLGLGRVRLLPVSAAGPARSWARPAAAGVSRWPCSVLDASGCCRCQRRYALRADGRRSASRSYSSGRL